MIIIRDYLESDAPSVGQLIADTYEKFNLSFTTPKERIAFLGPFAHARSGDKSKQAAIVKVIQASIVIVAEDGGGEIVGVLRGRKDKLQSLFVRGDFHRRGIGRRLVERFERSCIVQGTEIIHLMSTLYAIPFYQEMGYKKSTGIRKMKSFDGEGLPYQPMRKLMKSD